MAKVFSIINNKGGTGKTTTTLNLGGALAQIGKKVLLIDLDSQCNLSTSLGHVGTNEHHIGGLLLEKSNLQEVIVKNEKLDLIPSSEKLLDFEFQINNEPGREYLLNETISEIEKDYDYILVDCPPSLGTLSINALVASNFFIVPMQAENFAFIGLDKIIDMTEKVKKRMNPRLDLAGILFLKLSYRTKFSQAVLSNIMANDRLKNKIFETHIRQDIALMESAAFSNTIYEYAPKSRGAEDYLDLAKEIIKNYG